MEPDRKLATIVTIAALEPIPKADNIELASFKENSWNVVVKKNEFKVDDLAIYFSIDSILDVNNENTKFLEGKRLKTRKILGVISQGLAAPLSWLESYGVKISEYKVGDDVTNIMNVKKYVAVTEIEQYKEHNQNEKVVTFPREIVPQTHEERIQDCLGRLSEILFKNLDILITLKFDGTSFTVIYAKNHFMACGRNLVLIRGETPNHYFQIVDKYDLENKMRTYNRNLAIQGEICGPKINGNKMKRTENDFFVFNIYDIDNQYYLPFEEVKKITEELGLKMVTVIHAGKLTDCKDLKVNLDKTDSKYVKAWANALLEFASRQEYGKNIPAEGIVLKTNYGKEYPRVSCKIISNKYLLKHNE